MAPDVPRGMAGKKNPTKMKCVVVGDGAVGKTCLLTTYFAKAFPTEYVPTIMENFQVDIPVKDETLTMDIWDTAGQEEFAEIRALSYPDSDVFVLCYSCVSQASLDNLSAVWIPEVRKTVPNVPFVLAGTKVDLLFPGPDQRPKAEWVSQGDAETILSQYGGFEAFQCSALQGIKVNEVFKSAIRCYRKQFEKKKGGCSII